MLLLYVYAIVISRLHWTLLQISLYLFRDYVGKIAQFALALESTYCTSENNYVQVIEPTWTGANHVTLSEAKENFARFGASEEKLKACVRAPYPDEYPS